MSNAMLVIHPYKSNGLWVFDDAEHGLVREPFVSGVPEMIEQFTRNIANAEAGFDLYFSATPFPDYDAKLVWLRREYDGNWYGLEATRQTGWLCPALLKYFGDPPDEIYCKVAPRQSNLLQTSGSTFQQDLRSHFEKLEAKLDGLASEIRELSTRVTLAEETVAGVSVRFDQLETRLERVEQRLVLVERS